MAEGTNVGTLYIKVIPVLDQAAMSQIAQQAQNAAGGAGGGRGGRFVSGPASVAGGGTAFDPNGWKALNPGGWAAINAGGGGGGGMPPVFGNGVGLGGGGGGSSYNNVSYNNVINNMRAAAATGAARPMGGINFGNHLTQGMQHLAMTAMFGGWELGGAYQSRARAEEAVQQSGGNPVTAARAQLQHLERVGGGPLGSIIGAYDEYFGAGLQTRARQRLYVEEERQANREAGNTRADATEQARADSRGYLNERIGNILRTPYARAIRAAEDEGDDATEKFNAGMRKRQRAVDSAYGGDKRRKEAELDRYIHDESQVMMDAAGASRTKVDRINRDAQVGVDVIKSHGAAALLQKRGLFGRSAEAEFGGDMDRMQGDADRSGVPGAGEATRNLIALMTGGRAAANAYNTRARGRRADIQSALGRFDERGAIGIQGDQDRDEAHAYATDPKDEAERTREANARESNMLLRHSLSRGSELQSLSNQRDISAILADPSRSFGTQQRLAEVQGIFGAARGKANELFLQNKAPDAQLTLETAQNELSTLRRQMLAGVSMQEVSINRFAPGGEDMVTVLKKIEENTRQLKSQGGNAGATAQ
jgi:hypothetical protein